MIILQGGPNFGDLRVDFLLIHLRLGLVQKRFEPRDLRGAALFLFVEIRSGRG